MVLRELCKSGLPVPFFIIDNHVASSVHQSLISILKMSAGFGGHFSASITSFSYNFSICHLLISGVDLFTPLLTSV